MTSGLSTSARCFHTPPREWSTVRRAAVLLAVMLASTGGATCDRPYPRGLPLSLEREGACPFEGCRYGEWIARTDAAVKTDRNVDAQVHYRLRPGDRVYALTGVVITLRPGRVRVDHPLDLQSADGPVHLDANDTLYLLTYRSGGPTIAWHAGRLYHALDDSAFGQACEWTQETCTGARLERPRHTWWVQLRNEKGAVGWTNEPEKFEFARSP